MVAILALTLAATAYRGPLPARLAAQCRSRACSPLLVETETKKGGFSLPFFSSNVPEDQQPVKELQALRGQSFYDWPELKDGGYKDKLFNLYFTIMLLVSLPVSYTTFHQLPFELPQLFIAANIGTLAVMIPFVLRLRVGWASVSTRLKENTFYYESQQRGLFAKKDRETSGRDRLIQREQVAPVLRRIDVSTAAITFALVFTLVTAQVVTMAEGENGPTTLKTIYGDDATQYTNRLRGDDEFAKMQQERALRKGDPDGTGVKPGYCDSRYYRILAGGNSQGGVGCSD